MATVNGTVTDITGQPFAGEEVRFQPRSTPFKDNSNLVATNEETKVLPDDGSFSIVLKAGLYRVYIGKYDSILIRVPDDNNVYNIIGLITHIG